VRRRQPPRLMTRSRSAAAAQTASRRTLQQPPPSSPFTRHDFRRAGAFTPPRRHAPRPQRHYHAAARCQSSIRRRSHAISPHFNISSPPTTFSSRQDTLFSVLSADSSRPPAAPSSIFAFTAFHCRGRQVRRHEAPSPPATGYGAAVLAAECIHAAACFQRGWPVIAVTPSDALSHR